MNAIKQAAITLRNAARHNANASEANARRTERARELFNTVQAPILVDDRIAAANFPGTHGTYFVYLLPEGNAGCQCPDHARNGQLCKHMIWLAAKVITHK